MIGAFLREALEWGFESVALPVSEDGIAVSLTAARGVLLRIADAERPLLRRLQFLARDAALLESPGRGAA